MSDTPIVVHKPFNTQQLEHLERLFPVRGWTHEDTIENLAYAAGQRNVVEFIKAWSSRGYQL